jgi:hypothetical protein
MARSWANALPGGETFLGAGADAGKRGGEAGQALEVVHRVRVDVSDDCARAGNLNVTSYRWNFFR